MTTVSGRTGTKGVARADRERQIVDAAGKVFGEVGYARASIDEIAGIVGVSKPLIYHYFGAKDALYVACLREGGDAVVADLERTAALGEVGLARALAALEGMFDVLTDRRWVWRLLRDPTRPDTDEAAEILGRHYARVRELAEDGVGELLRLAGDDDAQDTDAMVAVWMSVFDALVTWWVDHPGVTTAEMTARCERLFSSVFGPLAGPTR